MVSFCSSVVTKRSNVQESRLARLTLTQKQQAMFEFIQRYLEEHHQAPYIREIQLACQIASYKSALDRLHALEHKGFIKRVPNKHRGITILRRSFEPIEPQSRAIEASSLQGAA